jgi:hypothetical protein
MKSACPRNEQKSWLRFEQFCEMARTGRYEEKDLHKAGVGPNRPPCEALNYPDLRHHG